MRIVATQNVGIAHLCKFDDYIDAGTIIGLVNL